MHQESATARATTSSICTVDRDALNTSVHRSSSRDSTSSTRPVSKSGELQRNRSGSFYARGALGLLAVLALLGCGHSARLPGSNEGTETSEIVFPTMDYPHSADLSPSFGHIQVYNGRDSDSDIHQTCVLAVIALYPGFASHQCDVKHHADKVMTTITEYKSDTETFATNIRWDRLTDSIDVNGRTYSRDLGRIFVIYKNDATSECEVLQVPGPPLGNSPKQVLAAVQAVAKTGKIYGSKEQLAADRFDIKRLQELVAGLTIR